MNKENHKKCREDKKVVILEHFLDSGEPVTILTQQTD
jgi:hypothetical protein